MKRILHLITSLQGGGTENFLWQMVTHSAPQWTHEVIYLRSDGVIGDRLRQAGISVQRMSNPLHLYRHFKETRPDILHTLLYGGHQAGRVIGRLAGVPFILSSQRAVDHWQKPWHRLVDRWTLRYSDGILVNSKAALEAARQRGFDKGPERVWILSNGVDTSRFTLEDKRAARRSLNWPEEAVIGGSLMRLHSEKGADWIPPVAARLLADHPELHLAIGGVGPLATTIRAQTRGYPWSNRLHWTGWVENSPRFLAALDFFWSLSREESFPQTLLEASLMGLPWTAPNVGGVSELVPAGCDVYERPGPDPALQAIERLLKDLPARTASSGGARAELLRTHSLDAVSRRFYAVLEACGPVRQCL